MRSAGTILLLVLACGCAGAEGDIKRARVREFFADLVRGKDRGYAGYRKTIEKAIQRGGGRGHYQYVPPAHVSSYLIQRSVRGLGGTKLRSADAKAGVADLLLEVLHRDPTAAIRASASHQLGRLLLELPAHRGELLPPDPKADHKIHEIATDLFQFHAKMRRGGKVTPGRVTERMEVLEGVRPSHILAAREMMRAVSGPPVGGSADPAVRAAAERLVPGIARDCILVALRDVACGGPEAEPDPSPIVRAHAAEVLARVGSPAAFERAVERLWDPYDPGERDADVRRHLLAYMGAVGGPVAFETCLRRLEDVDSGVRFHAQRALVRMTGTAEPSTAGEWSAWRGKRPRWKLPG